MTVYDTTDADILDLLLLKIHVRIHVVILVYDLTDKNSLEQLKSTHHARVQKTGLKYSRMVLVANKEDIRYPVEEERIEARKFRDKYSMLFFITNAESGRNVNKMFDTLARESLAREQRPNEEPLHCHRLFDLVKEYRWWMAAAIVAIIAHYTGVEPGPIHTLYLGIEYQNRQ